MSKTIREIAEMLDISAKDLVKEKQKIRDEIKRQNIKPVKEGNRFLIDDADVDDLIKVLRVKKNEENSKKLEENREYLRKISRLEGENRDLKSMLHVKSLELDRLREDKDIEIRKLNEKIAQFAEDFKGLNDKQLQLNNQQQQLQARVLEQTKQLEDSHQQLLDSAEKSSELQNKVDKMKNASLWQRIMRKF